eukprot:830146-Prymnesium_polylepis.1
MRNASSAEEGEVLIITFSRKSARTCERRSSDEHTGFKDMRLKHSRGFARHCHGCGRFEEALLTAQTLQAYFLKKPSDFGQGL